jgi:hypothetical protein
MSLRGRQEVYISRTRDGKHGLFSAGMLVWHFTERWEEPTTKAEAREYCETYGFDLASDWNRLPKED